MIHDLEIALLRTFVTIVDSGSLTEAGRRVGRSQPAITHQLKRLEDALDRRIFDPDRRVLRLTRDGELLLQFARGILRLNDEVRQRFSGPEVEGNVVLGTPDLYAAYLLPDVLESFAKAYPRVAVELRCTRSVHLHAALQRAEIDLALMTRQPEFPGGTTLRHEPLVWVASRSRRPETEPVLPLALLPPGSVYRKRALDALSSAGREWRISSVCDSIAGLQAAVLAGLAVAVFPSCATSNEMRRLGPTEGLPDLPDVELTLHRRPDSNQDAADHLAEYIASKLPHAVPDRLRLSKEGYPPDPA